MNGHRERRAGAGAEQLAAQPDSVVAKKASPASAAAGAVMAGAAAVQATTVEAKRLEPAVSEEKRLEEKSPRSKPAESATGEGSIRLLLVDEHPGMAEALGRLLDSRRYVCEAVRSGLDALCRVSERPPQLILADMACPDLDGFQLCALLKSRPAYRHIPLLLLSRRPDLFDRLRAEALGAAAVLALPFSREELLRGLEESLREPGADANPPARS